MSIAAAIMAMKHVTHGNCAVTSGVCCWLRVGSRYSLVAAVLGLATLNSSASGQVVEPNSVEQSPAPSTAATSGAAPQSAPPPAPPTAIDQASGEAVLDDDAVLQYVAPKTFDMLIGLRIAAADGSMYGTKATTVFPTPWPEQQVEIVQTNVPPSSKNQFRDLPGGNRQWLFFIPTVPAAAAVEATVTVRITKSHIVGPSDTLRFTIPKRISRDLKQFMSNSPFIESTSTEVRKIVREIEATEPLTDWKKAEMLYDWVRDNIAYERGELKSVRDAIRDKTGDCEEMTSTFVALCRAARIPARCVWVPNHCYPEFYLEDEQGEGHWFPCQVAGTRSFGSMPDYLPILQKGDRFKVPEKPEMQRYLADFLQSQKVLGNRDPQVEFIRQMLGDAANIQAPDLDGQANQPSAAEQIEEQPAAAAAAAAAAAQDAAAAKQTQTEEAPAIPPR